MHLNFCLFSANIWLFTIGRDSYKVEWGGLELWIEGWLQVEDKSMISDGDVISLFFLGNCHLVFLTITSNHIMWIRRKLYREAIQEHGVCNTCVCASTCTAASWWTHGAETCSWMNYFIKVCLMVRSLFLTCNILQRVGDRNVKKSRNGDITSIPAIYQKI